MAFGHERFSRMGTMKNFDRVARVGLCVWLLIPPLFTNMLAWSAAVRWWNPPSPEYEGTFYEQDELRFQLWCAVAFAVMCAAGALANLRNFWRSAPERFGKLELACLWAMPLIAMSTPVCRVLLPIEDPYTGGGSPLAAMVGVVGAGVFFGLLFALPSLMLFAGAGPSGPRAIGRDNH